MTKIATVRMIVTVETIATVGMIVTVETIVTPKVTVTVGKVTVGKVTAEMIVTVEMIVTEISIEMTEIAEMARTAVVAGIEMMIMMPMEGVRGMAATRPPRTRAEGMPRWMTSSQMEDRRSSLPPPVATSHPMPVEAMTGAIFQVLPLPL